MGSKFKRLCIINYPCINCIIIPCGCFEICNKVEVDKEKLFNHFKENSFCPDCGGNVKHVELPFGSYQQCDFCKHRFMLIYLTTYVSNFEYEGRLKKMKNPAIKPDIKLIGVSRCL